MRRLFGNTNLPRCEGDWCTKVIVGQYLVNYRKNLARSTKAANHVVKGLPTPDELEAEYQREVRNDPNHSEDEDDGFVAAEELEEMNDATAGPVDVGTGAVVGSSSSSGEDTADDADDASTDTDSSG
jgi:hypothetical protein